MIDKFTSLELSKKLKENGCDLDTNMLYVRRSFHFEEPCEEIYLTREYDMKDADKWGATYYIQAKAYDILWDICIKYAKEFFDETWKLHTKNIFCLIQNNEKQKAEEYIWEHTIFNKENKK
jgi:hypothetical protein